MNSISNGGYTTPVSQPQSFKLDSSVTRIIPNAEDAIDAAKPRNEEEAAYFTSMHERLEEALQQHQTFLANNSTYEQQYARWEKTLSEPVHAVIEKDGEVVGILSENGKSYGRNISVPGTILTEYNTDEDKIAALKEIYGDDVTVNLYNDENPFTWGEASEQRLGYEMEFRYTNYSERGASFYEALERQINAYNERVEGLKPASGDIVDIET